LYAEVDDDGDVVGTDPEILKALKVVRGHFRLRGTP
jgi:hypothetical protein